jgi:hypothetical protein
LDAIEKDLVVDTLVFRYDVEDASDGLDGDEGTFLMCSFWYVEALTRAGRLDDARIAPEKMFTYANHLGRYAEEIGLTGDQLGNFPQAVTHLSLISAAINLDRALGWPGILGPCGSSCSTHPRRCSTSAAVWVSTGATRCGTGCCTWFHRLEGPTSG